MLWFRGNDGRLRPNWRVLVPVALLVVWAAGSVGLISDVLLSRLETEGLWLLGERAMLVGAVVAILLVTMIVLGLVLSHDLSQPLRSMVDAAGALVQGDYARRVGSSSIRELNTLAGAMNQLAQQMQAQMAELRHQAFYDPLTGLPNRALFMDRLQRALGRARRTHSRVAVMYLDLDNFKLVNDSLGHNAGDALLIELAKRLQDCLRTGDTAARLGGDEFTVLLEQLEDVGHAVRVAERILEQLRAPFTLDGQELYAGSSIGITIGYPIGDLGPAPGDLLREADVAMYRAKQQGKGRYAIFDPSMEAHVMARLALESDLRRAVERGEFLIYYQPIVSLDGGDDGDETEEIEAVEALLRWEHPQRGLILPGEFIGVAEETGLIVPIGRWVLREACRQVRAWHDAAPPRRRPLGVSVNLSARQFSDPLLVDAVTAVLRETELPPSCLTLEITESVAMEDVETTLVTLRALKRLGVGLAMDDFGTGFSALAYLKRFPIDTLKIDRTFVRGLGDPSSGVRSPEDVAIVRAAIAFGKSLSLRVTTEGIETTAQLACVRELGSDCGQGFYFAPPKAAGDGDLVRWLATAPQRAGSVEQRAAREGARALAQV